MLIKRSLVLLFVTALALPAVADEAVCVRKVVDHKGMCMRTYLAMKSIQTAVEAYGVAHNVFPKATAMAELRALIEPAYIRTTPMTDDWGTEFKYVVSADGQHYKIISAGSDRAFAPETWDAAGLLSSSADDQVLTSEARDREWTLQK